MKVIGALVALISCACTLAVDGEPPKAVPDQAPAPEDGPVEANAPERAPAGLPVADAPQVKPVDTTKPETRDPQPTIVEPSEEDQGAFGVNPEDVPSLYDYEDEDEHITQAVPAKPAVKNYGKYRAWEALAKKIDDVVTMREKKAQELVDKLGPSENKEAKKKLEEMKKKAQAVKAVTAKIIEAGKEENLKKGEEESAKTAFETSSSLFNALKEYQDEQVDTEAEYIKAAIKENRGKDVLTVITKRVTILSDAFHCHQIATILTAMILLSLNWI